MRHDGSETHRPLAGVRVLDVTQVMAGAYCSMLLGDMGADVVKIEKPAGGDDTRAMGQFTPHGESPAFMAVNRNKRGVVLDLANERGADVLRRMAATADVLVENLRPGTLTRFGLGYRELAELNPTLIYCTISGYGASGPYASKGGFDLIAQGMSGLMSITGEPGRPPVKVGVPICDLNAGMYGAYGVLSAYIHRLRTGEGQYVDTSLLEGGVAYTLWETALWTSMGTVAEPTGSAHRLAAPYEAFPTADGYLTVGAANERIWQRLCQAIGREDLTHDPRFAQSGDRLANREALAEILGAVFRQEDTAAWLERLDAAQVPAGPIYDISEVYNDPQVQARNMLVDVEHPTAGRTQQIGHPVKLSATPAGVDRPAPLLGQHTREVLLDYGFEAAEVDALSNEHVIAEAATENAEGST